MCVFQLLRFLAQVPLFAARAEWGELTRVCTWWRKGHRRAVSQGSVSRRPARHNRTTRRPAAASPSVRSLQGYRKHTALHLGQRTATETWDVMPKWRHTCLATFTQSKREASIGLATHCGLGPIYWRSACSSADAVMTEPKLSVMHSVQVFDSDTIISTTSSSAWTQTSLWQCACTSVETRSHFTVRWLVSISHHTGLLLLHNV